MTITICEGYDNSYVILSCKHAEFRKNYGCTEHGVKASNVYRELAAVAEWVNNELGEECLFEIG